MEFEVIFYRSEAGKCPVTDFLDELERTDRTDYDAILSKLLKLRFRANHREPLSKPLKDGLFELRHKGKLNSRLLYFFRRGRRIIVTHAVRNKGQKLSKKDINIAHQRMREWIEREESERN